MSYQEITKFKLPRDTNPRGEIVSPAYAGMFRLTILCESEML